MPFTPSMKLNALTTPVVHTAAAAAVTASLTGVVGSGLISTQATTMPAEHCSTSRWPTDSPDRSSASPIAAKSATAMPNAADPALCMSAAATRSPAAIGAPPPRSVGTVCDDLGPGTSMADARRRSAIVGGSAVTTMAPAVSAMRRPVIAAGGRAWSAPPTPRSRAAARSPRGYRPRRRHIRSRTRLRTGCRMRSAWSPR
jgi:hypothetical protein